MKVLMIPNLSHFDREESGIRRVVEGYHRYAKDCDIEFVYSDIENEDSYDLIAIHAGSSSKYPVNKPIVSICHGLYWTADYAAPMWEYSANSNVIKTIRKAREVTVPSRWVAKTFERDMHFTPHVIPHGVEWNDWQHNEENGGYVLWNKNRDKDVCDPTPVKMLAELFSKINFVATFAPENSAPNIHITNLLPHAKMKPTIQRAGVYLSTTKETFGIGVLEAMASGVPVLGWRFGNNVDLVEHGVTGYLAQPGNYQDLADGLNYCIRNRKVLGDNARIKAKQWRWDKSVQLLRSVFELALVVEKPTVTVVIPTYNYGTEDKLGRAIKSVCAQNYPRELVEIRVVNDGSEDGGRTDQLADKYILEYRGHDIKYIKQPNQGVAISRNNGIAEGTGKYICCLDADDAIAPEFLSTCIRELEKDDSLGNAFTGLYYITPDGKEGVSSWPDKFDYDRQIARANQIPTCCVFRRKIWERTGGYRQRYAPHGAGSEDAEFWLRMGAYGWDARKVTNEGLFIYSWMSGRVSGNKEYREMDWLAWHPWTQDGQHPFASMATPKRMSHPVRQYDEPLISVVIPVGPGHEKEIINALDSLEAQTFRKWEAIVAWDSPEEPDKILKAYPYISLIAGNTSGKGAGYARNRGAENAKGSFLVFLDADDWLYPTALDKMMAAWTVKEAIIYTDYIGKGVVEDTSKLAQDLQKNLLDWDAKTKVAVVKHRASNYDCERAVIQPVVDENNEIKDVYLWANVTCLVPTAWHKAIGGFDENMPSWEDVDYHWRMARAGYCYTRIPEELLVYRFYSGFRRQKGLQNFRKLIQYLQGKYKEVATMPCSGCGQSVTRPVTKIYPGITTEKEMDDTMNDENFVLAEYMHPNRGQHSVVGAGSGIKYGYRGGGDTFLVHKNDIAAQPHLFRAIPMPRTAVEKAPEPTPIKESESMVKEAFLGPQVSDSATVLDKPVSLDTSEDEFDLQTLAGMTPAIAETLLGMGVSTPEAIVQLGIEGIQKIKGVGPSRAYMIIDTAEKIISGE